MSDAPPWDGVPRDPERDGWHWLRWDTNIPGAREPYAAFWLSGSGGFANLAPCTHTPRLYLGPCHTPAEVAALTSAAWQAGWAAGREAAAEVVGAVRDWGGQDYYCDSCKGGAVYPDAEQVAASIRALPVPPPPHG